MTQKPNTEIIDMRDWDRTWLRMLIGNQINAF